MRLPSLTLTILATGGLLLAPAPSPAQGPARSAKERWQPARTPDGQPDIQGIWQTQGGNLTVSLERDGVTLLESDRVGFLDEGAARATTPVGIVDPPDGRVPVQGWAAARRKEIADNYRDPKGNFAVMDPSARCLAAGVPRINYVTPYNGYQFFQVPGYVVLFAEWNHEARIIPLDGRPHLPAGHRQWMGDSRGRWEGATLVVDVTNFNGRAWFDWLTFHSEALHVVERFTVVDAETINYEATIDDPKVFTKPWKVAFPFKRGGRGYRLFEYACHEGNRYMESSMK
jgi:hypothetical protein